MAKAKPKTVVPKLRFPEFRNAPEWNLEQGDELFDAINTRTPQEPLPILAITQEFGAIPRDQIDYHVSVTEQSLESYKLVEKGDFIISLRSFQGGIEYSNYRGICSPAYVILRRKGGGSDTYFRHLLKTSKFIQQLTRNIEGLRDGKMISYKQFSDQLIPAPLPDEQKKIADCLTSLDELIAAQGRKVETLKAYKRGLMQQLFPRDGETVPRLRFPEFKKAPEWKEISLSKLGHLISGLTYNPADVRDSGLLVLRSSNVQDSEIRLDDNVFVTSNVQGANLARPNDILICVRNGSKTLIGKNALIPEGMPLCTHGAFMTVFRANNPQFAFQLMQSKGFQDQVSADLGATINSINGGKLLKYRFVVPESDEQKKVAECLGFLSTRVAAELKKLTAMKRHKIAIMQQLFPSVEEDAA